MYSYKKLLLVLFKKLFKEYFFNKIFKLVLLVDLFPTGS